MARRENAYTSRLINDLLEKYPGALVLKQDANLVQGIPDRLILWRDRWASLEIKRDKNSPVQPNQPYYIELMNRMSFAAFIYPENEEEVLRGLDIALRA